VLDGHSVGWHYAGPNWEYIDGSSVTGKVVASAPGATSNEIPSLELEVVDQRGDGILSAATADQRINTKGGVAQGSCERAGDCRSAPYSADYVVQRKATDGTNPKSRKP
jgi:hypothetical protein